LRKAELQGANLREAQLQGADFRGAGDKSLIKVQLQGVDLRRAMLQGAKLERVELQGADLRGAEIWLASFPDDLATQLPVPRGVAELEMSPLRTQRKTDLAEMLQANITDSELLEKLLYRLNPILREDPEKWEDEDRWRQYVSVAKEQPPEEIAQFLADMTCEDPEGYIAVALANRAATLKDERQYRQVLATALLNGKCKGATALSDEMRARLEKLGSATE
jgi:uncharacterized protein YjbI with pentapeptide repeats